MPFLAVMADGTVLAARGYVSLAGSLADFLDVLLLIFAPWSAVSLTGFCVLRHGYFHVPSFSGPGGRYGRCSWRGLAACAARLPAEIPFISQASTPGRS